MVWSALTIIHLLIETNFGRQGIWLPIVLGLDAILCTLAVTIAKGDLQFIFFHFSFGSAELLSFILMFRIYKSKKQSHPFIKYLFERGALTYFIAIVIWMIDLNLCE